MSPFATSATVEEHGRVRLDGVPFEPGTRVEVTITLAVNGTHLPGSTQADPVARLLASLDKSRNVETVGPLKRAELYDRDILR